MFARISTEEKKQVTVCFDGQELKVTEGLSVAAALLEAGVEEFRKTPVKNSSRNPFCMMGVCFDCLVRIDGLANQQSCMMSVREGMTIERQNGSADVMEFVE